MRIDRQNTTGQLLNNKWKIARQLAQWKLKMQNTYMHMNKDNTTLGVNSANIFFKVVTSVTKADYIYCVFVFWLRGNWHIDDESLENGKGCKVMINRHIGGMEMVSQAINTGVITSF